MAFIVQRPRGVLPNFILEVRLLIRAVWNAITVRVDRAAVEELETLELLERSGNHLFSKFDQKLAAVPLNPLYGLIVLPKVLAALGEEFRSSTMTTMAALQDVAFRKATLEKQWACTLGQMKVTPTTCPIAGKRSSVSSATRSSVSSATTDKQSSEKRSGLNWEAVRQSGPSSMHSKNRLEAHPRTSLSTTSSSTHAPSSRRGSVAECISATLHLERSQKLAEDETGMSYTMKVAERLAKLKSDKGL